MTKFKIKTASALAGQALAAIVLVAYSGAALAQMTPIGTWRSIDDSTKEPKAQVVITESGGVLTGRIEKVLTSIDIKAKRPVFVGREDAASPATGLARIHQQQQEALVRAALGL